MERSGKRGTQGWEIPDGGSSKGSPPSSRGRVRFGSVQSRATSRANSEARLAPAEERRPGFFSCGRGAKARLRLGNHPRLLCVRTRCVSVRGPAAPSLCGPAAPSPCAPAAASLNADRQPLPRRSPPRPRPQPARLANGSSLPRTPRPPPPARRAFYAALGFPAAGAGEGDRTGRGGGRFL